MSLIGYFFSYMMAGFSFGFVKAWNKKVAYVGLVTATIVWFGWSLLMGHNPPEMIFDGWSIAQIVVAFVGMWIGMFGGAKAGQEVFWK